MSVGTMRLGCFFGAASGWVKAWLCKGERNIEWNQRTVTAGESLPNDECKRIGYKKNEVMIIKRKI
jgi:hypothetical protein